MKDTRPVNLNLMQIKFPIPAIASILHRLSGIVVFLFIPLLLWALKYSLTSPEDFMRMKAVLNIFWVKLALWAFLAAFVYHLLAGIRHLAMDLGHGETLTGGRVTAWFVIIVSILLTCGIGVYLWV